MPALQMHKMRHAAASPLQNVVLVMHDLAQTLQFHLLGIFSTTPEPQQPAVLQRVRIVARMARQLLPVTFTDDDCDAAAAGRMALMADLTEWVAGHVAGSAVVEAAAKLPVPSGSACPLDLLFHG